MVALGMLFGLWIALKEAQRKKIKPEAILDLFFWMILSAIVGSRLLYVLLFWRNYIGDPLGVFRLWEGGLVLYGGVIAAVLALWLYVRAKKLSMLKIMDVFAPALALGIFIGRFGCYFIGDHIGSIMKHDFFWGSVMSEGAELRHEPSLYLSLNGLLLFLFLWSRRLTIKITGHMTMLFLIWYGVSRFAIDFFRATDLPGSLSDPRFWGLTISQYVSLLLVAAGLWYLNKTQPLRSLTKKR